MKVVIKFIVNGGFNSKMCFILNFRAEKRSVFVSLLLKIEEIEVLIGFNLPLSVFISLKLRVKPLNLSSLGKMHGRPDVAVIQF